MVLRAIYPRARGRIFLRGSSAGLDWFHNRAPDEIDGDASIFRLTVPHYDPVQIKLVRDDGAWMVGRNAVIGRDDEVVLRPAFDRSTREISGLRTVPLPWGGALHVRVRLPASYQEQEQQRYVEVLARRSVRVLGRLDPPRCFRGSHLPVVVLLVGRARHVEDCLGWHLPDATPDLLSRLRDRGVRRRVRRKHA